MTWSAVEQQENFQHAKTLVFKLQQLPAGVQAAWNGSQKEGEASQILETVTKPL